MLGGDEEVEDALQRVRLGEPAAHASAVGEFYRDVHDAVFARSGSSGSASFAAATRASRAAAAAEPPPRRLRRRLLGGVSAARAAASAAARAASFRGPGAATPRMPSPCRYGSGAPPPPPRRAPRPGRSRRRPGRRRAAGVRHRSLVRHAQHRRLQHARASSRSAAVTPSGSSSSAVPVRPDPPDPPLLAAPRACAPPNPLPPAPPKPDRPPARAPRRTGPRTSDPAPATAAAGCRAGGRRAASFSAPGAVFAHGRRDGALQIVVVVVAQHDGRSSVPVPPRARRGARAGRRRAFVDGGASGPRGRRRRRSGSRPFAGPYPQPGRRVPSASSSLARPCTPPVVANGGRGDAPLSASAFASARPPARSANCRRRTHQPRGRGSTCSAASRGGGREGARRRSAMRREPCEVTETASCDAQGVARRRAATRGRPRSDGRAFSRRPTARAVRRNVIGKGLVAYLQDRARCARVARRHRRERLQRRRLLGRTRHLGRVARWGSACPQPGEI